MATERHPGGSSHRRARRLAAAVFGAFLAVSACPALAADSEAELQIVPDVTVDEGGCVVRTSFGSIDARIDTQLSELKAVLMEVATRAEEGAGGL